MGEQLELFPEFKKTNVVSYRSKTSKDYADFLAKFDTPKTTDDCFTPPAVYDVVLDYALKINPPAVEGLDVVRPFYPNGDYKALDYSGAVVVDNPLFSILTQIIRFYQQNAVKFFLFAPFNSCINTVEGVSTVIVSADVAYANNARVRTSFVTNLYPEKCIMIDAELRAKIEQSQAIRLKQQTINDHHPNVCSAAMFGKYTKCQKIMLLDGVDYAIEKNPYIGYSVFGGGVLLSDSAVNKLNSASYNIDVAETDNQQQKIVRKLTPIAEKVLEKLNKKVQK